METESVAAEKKKAAIKKNGHEERPDDGTLESVVKIVNDFSDRIAGLSERLAVLEVKKKETSPFARLNEAFASYIRTESGQKAIAVYLGESGYVRNYMESIFSDTMRSILRSSDLAIRKNLIETIKEAGVDVMTTMASEEVHRKWNDTTDALRETMDREIGSRIKDLSLATIPEFVPAVEHTVERYLGTKVTASYRLPGLEAWIKQQMSVRIASDTEIQAGIRRFIGRLLAA